MTTIKDELREGVEEVLADLRSMRDEVRLKIHLGNMELQDRWEKLEPRVGAVEREIEKGGKVLGEGIKAGLLELRDGLRALRRDLGKGD